ncbi:MAG: Ribonuclease Y [Chlamydiales bacterium]|nr:Ribonuclease Y [Chlamydiales bacterium]MCH9635842.1 Ribonuclease Y [Chlamydiales bacterium]MCH9704137.1 ribonuclease Y [Chlamydiota bacterium]
MWIISFAVGVALFWIIFKVRKGGFERLAQEIVHKAESDMQEQKQELLLSLKEREKRALLDEHTRQERLDKEKVRLQDREERLERRATELERKFSQIQKKEELLQNKERELLGSSTAAAKEELLNKLSAEVELETLAAIVERKKQKELEADRDAARVIATAINRLALPTVSDVVTTTVALPNDEMKRRIIGREGKNIRTLEKLTGVNFLFDDTPHAIVLSSFDPFRKEVAKQSLKELMRDGRIHPTRIEEVVLRMEKEIQQRTKERGEKAALEANVLGLHPELLQLLGQLSFRHSYGQNVLDHSIEVSRIMRIMAEELKLDSQLAKRIGLLHDIGKAALPEKEGSHALLGHDLALKYGESHNVANGIGCHHDEMVAKTAEAVLCSAADALSGGRPGARIESVASYIQRLKKLEQLAHDFDGVDKAYALSAGRELRVIVKPEEIDDAHSLKLARDLARKIEKSVSYPGKIKVTVIREQKSSEYAL